MHYSFYEVYTNCLRALSGMGFPYGADEDAAFIIAWLELNKLKGIRFFANLIPDIDGEYNGKININKNEFIIDLDNNSVLMKGPGIIDYFKLKLQHKDNVKITINNCSDALCFLPLLYKNSNSVYSNLIYNDKNGTILCNIEKNSVKISNSKTLLKKNQAKIIMSNKYKSIRLEDIKLVINADTIQKNLSQSLQPHKKYWQIIEKIANRTFVPESEESRSKGAGGSDDND